MFRLMCSVGVVWRFLSAVETPMITDHRFILNVLNLCDRVLDFISEHSVGERQTVLLRFGYFLYPTSM